MAISALPSIQMAHTALLVRNIKGGGLPPPEDKEPKEPKKTAWERFKKWWREN